MKNNYQPAFPSPQFAVPESLSGQAILMLQKSLGMTLRDYFAAKAMQAIVAKEGCTDGVLQALGAGDVGQTESFAEDDARRAYIYADAMMAEREK